MRSYDRSHTEFAVHVRWNNLTPNAIKLSIPMGTLENAPQSSSALPSTAATAAPSMQQVTETQAAPPPDEARPDFELKPGKEW
jgi:hypothetical protein